MTRSHAHRIAALVLPVVAGLTVAVAGPLLGPAPVRGEEFEALHCYTGTFTAIHGTDELTPASHWAHHGILRSSNKNFENAATYCAAARSGALDPRGRVTRCAGW